MSVGGATYIAIIKHGVRIRERLSIKKTIYIKYCVEYWVGLSQSVIGKLTLKTNFSQVNQQQLTFIRKIFSKKSLFIETSVNGE